MSNNFVNASVKFLTQSWYRENAGTYEVREAKFLDKIFEDIVDYFVDLGVSIDKSIDLANEIIEEDLIEEFYEDILNEASSSLPSVSSLINKPQTPTMDPFRAGGGEAKMRQTGMTRQQVMDLGSRNLQRTSSSPSSTRPTTTPSPAKEPTAPPVPRPTMARLGQDPRDSIFSRGTSMSPQQARSEYENKMRQAIRGGTREIYRLPGNTGMTDLSNAGRG